VLRELCLRPALLHTVAHSRTPSHTMSTEQRLMLLTLVSYCSASCCWVVPARNWAINSCTASSPKRSEGNEAAAQIESGAAIGCFHCPIDHIHALTRSRSGVLSPLTP